MVWRVRSVALLGGFLAAGAGTGLLNPVIADVALKVVPREQSGMAAGINDTFRQVGVAVGVALWGAIFLARGAAKVAALTAGTPAATGDAGFLAGLNEILLIAGGLALAGALLAPWLVRKQDIDEHAAATLEAAPEPSPA